MHAGACVGAECWGAPPNTWLGEGHMSTLGVAQKLKNGESLWDISKMENDRCLKQVSGCKRV